MGTNTGIGIGIGIPFKNNALGGDRPYLPPELKARLIGVWDNYGKKNTDADRNIIKNKIPNAGGDLEILNAAYKLNSGFGKYKEDFTSWRIYPNIEVTDNVITTNGNFNLTWFIYKHSSESKINEMNIKVSGIPKGGKILYFYISDETANLPIAYTIPKDGIYHLPESKINNNRVSVGFTVESRYDWNNIRIEQIPSFEGAFVTDGIDDLITSTKTVQEMGITDEITVVSMIHKISSDNNWTNLIGELKEDHTFVANRATNTDKTGIYGYTYNHVGDAIVINNILGDKNDYIVRTSTSLGLDNKYYVTGFRSAGIIQNISQVAWYWTIIANKVLTSDQINQVIAYFNLDRTLKPDILCNTIKQGITNENHAEFGDKLIDFSGNGRDIQLNNIAWKGYSGIGKYNFSNINIIASRFEGTVTTNKCHFTKKLTNTTNNFCDLIVISPNEPIKFKVSGLSDGRKLFVANKSDSGSNYNFDNGEHEVSLSFPEGVIQNNPFGVTGDIGDIDVTVEFIPSHAGALCLDGVNDFGKVTGMPIYKDYTFIIDYERISCALSERWVAGVVSKSHVANQGAFILMTANTEVEPGKQAYSFGGVTSFNRDDFTRALLYQSKYKCGDVDLTVGEGVDSDTLWLGTFRDNDQRFFNGAIYSLMSFPYSMSEFLIERQLKKHKLGTLYPDMVEFRPIIKQDDRIKNVKYYKLNETADYIDLNIGDYIPVGQRIAIVVDLEEPYKITSITSSSLTDVEIRKAGGQNYAYDILGYVTDKSPQKITMDIQVDSSLVQWNPVVESNAEYQVVDFYIDTYPAVVGNYYLISSKLRVVITTKGAADEVTSLTVNGVSLGTPSINGNRFTFNGTLPDKSPQNINIAIDEYIRFEDIVQPYPVLLRFNDENGNEVSWGGKFRVGSTITRIGNFYENNLLDGLYVVRNPKLNGNNLITPTHVVEKSMVFTCDTEYLLDNNEPKCILSPSRLRIPNSSYKILGYIPDISGHGNNGVIHNSAYAEGSGVNEDGSYQFDGVDDFVTIPTIAGKQVLIKLNWQNKAIGNLIYDQRDNSSTTSFAIMPISINDTTNNKIAYQTKNANGITYIDGIRNEYIESYSLENIIHNITITNPDVSNKTVALGASNRTTADYFAKYALYDFMLFDDISTEDKIKELNEYVGIEAKVELPPYYWDAYGKSNLDEDRDSIKQRGVAVGDYDLTNTNFAYDKMSGFGGYEFTKFDNTSEWTNRNRKDGIEIIKKNGYSFTAKRIGTGQYFYDFQNRSTTVLNKSLTVKAVSNNNTCIRWDYKYRTAEKPDIDSTLLLVRQAMIPNVPITVALPYKTEQEKADLGVTEGSDSYLFYFDPSDIPVGEEYTVEMLPLYPNGLLYDAVSDYSENVNIPVFTDFTAIMKRKWLKNQGCPLIKGSKVYEGGNGNALLFEWDKAYNFVFYKRTDIMEREVPENISFITPTNYNGNVITRGSGQDTNGICIAGDGNAGFANMVFYKLILYPKTIPLLQINFLKNLMERDEIIDLNNPIFIKS